MSLTKEPEITAPTVTPLCPVCSAPGFAEQRLPDCTVCRCGTCGHCFTDLGSIDGLEEYEASYFEKEHRNWFRHPNLALYGRLFKIISKHNPSASVLDVGCGNGNFLRYLQTRSGSLSLTGIDMAPNELSAGIHYIQGDFLNEKSGRHFDVLVSLAVIEHIPDVAAFARRLDQLCVPGGLVITMTVDERSLIYSAARTLNRAGYATPAKRLYSKHHLNHFTGSSLRRLLEQQGLSTVKVIRHNSPLAAVDMPPMSAFRAAILSTGVWMGFVLGQLMGRTMLQTVVSKKSA